MKIMIASDVHGSAYYCEKMLEVYEKERAERLLLLGDILYHGPRNELPKDYNPKQVIHMLNPWKEQILCVRGNCDSEVDQMVLEFPIMADYAYVINGKTSVYTTHGHVYNEYNLLPMPKNSIFLHGHTHIPKCTVHENYINMNPGSVSIPKEESWHGYMIWEEELFQWKDLESNIHMEYRME